MKPVVIRLGALGGNDRVDITNTAIKLSKRRGDDNRTKQILLTKLEKAQTVNKMVMVMLQEFGDQVDFHEWSDQHQKWFSTRTLARFFYRG